MTFSHIQVTFENTKFNKSNMIKPFHATALFSILPENTPRGFLVFSWGVEKHQ